MTDTGSGAATAVETPSASSSASTETSTSTSASSATTTAPQTFRQAIDRMAADEGAPSGDDRTTRPDPASGHDADAAASAVPPDPFEAKLAEAKKAWEADLGPWNEIRQQVTAEDFQQVIGHMRRLAEDPVGFYRDFGQELQQSGLMAGQTAQDAPQSESRPFAMPDADLVAEDGTKAYSADRLAEIIKGLTADVDRRLAEKFQPIEAERAEREVRDMQTRQHEQAKSMVETARKDWTGFTELEPQIKALMLQDRRYSLEGAYLKLFNQSYLPTLKQRERDAFTKELATKAAATTTRPAGSVSRGGATPVKSFRQAIERNGGSSVAEQVFG